jgi:hypothetical protein
MAITKVTTPVTGFESLVDIGLKIPVGTNSNLPTGVEGMIRNDTEEISGGTDSTTAITFYNGTDWKYFNSTKSGDGINVNYLVVAGGGGGSNELGGGGGAGGYLTNIGGTEQSLQYAVTYTVVVGDGGRGGVIGSARDSENTRGGDGDNSSLSGSDITTITSTGGGGGGALGPNVRYGRNGGSGGGAAAYDPGGIGTTVGLGNTPSTTPSQGNSGGNSYKASGVYAGGGGGGAGVVGGNYKTNTSPYGGGNGGDGLPNIITGASPIPYYAGGGGGSGYGSNCNAGYAGIGGNGGGGNSGTGRDCANSNGSNGTNGLGGGGGSATYAPSTQSGGSGGSGVVIIRYPIANNINIATGTSPIAADLNATVSGSSTEKFTRFLATGTVTFTIS